MPFYLDRHEVDEPLSPKEVAMAHYNDVLIQEEHDCKVMTYWRGDDNKSAYCLIHAPSPEKLKALHAASHGMIPNEIIEVDLAEVEAVLGRTSDPLPLDSEQALQDNIDEFSEAIDSAFRVIMFTDLKDSTLMTTELGQEKALELLITHNKIIRKVLKEHHGTEVKHTGDGLMVSFINVPDSLACACGIQDAFAEYNTNNPE
ncbi:MAG: DUF4242 domain-containing protein, partial [Anaerolineae bacterium]|nr:DUF4242 domain-containing protein [Anaerolineae bacterium]